MAPAESTPTKTFTRAEVANHNIREDLWVVINNSVYDVTKYLEEHPGGEEIVMDQAGKDATEEFEDAEHSTDAREIMQKYKIGDIVQEERLITKDKKKKRGFGIFNGEHSCRDAWKLLLIPIVLGITAAVVYRYGIRTR